MTDAPFIISKDCMEYSHKLRSKIASIKAAGLDTFLCIADFDRTITLPSQHATSWGAIRQFFPDQEYRTKAQALYDYYRPIELDPIIPIEQKIQHMSDWWEKHIDLIVRLGISRQDIRELLGGMDRSFRDGVTELFALLDLESIPLHIFSAGLGDFIIQQLTMQDVLLPNITIQSNFFVFDEAGKAVDYTKPLIHCHNKHEQKKEGFDQYKSILLLGDTIEDLGMTEGLKYDTLISVAFTSQENKKEFENLYDIVLPEDAGMEAVIDLVKDVI